MRRRWLVCVLGVLVLGAHLAAQTDVSKFRRMIRWVKTFDNAKAVAEDSNTPIILYFYQTNSPACLKFEEQIFADRTFRALTSLFLMVRVDGTRPDEIAAIATQFGVKKYPTLVYLDSAAEKLHLLDTNITTKRALSRMGQTYLTSLYNSGKRARDAGDIRRAVRRYRTVMLIGEGTPPANWAKRDLDRIAVEGIKKVSQARIALDAKDYVRTMTLLDELLYEYRALPAGAEAKKVWDGLVDDPKAIDALVEVGRRRNAGMRLARAKKTEEQKNLEAALILYWDTSRDYPNTPAATEADTRAKELARDEALAARAAKSRMERDCRLWMEMAKDFADNRKIDTAVEYYRKVVTYYGDTPYAQKAREAINKLLGTAPKK